MGNKLEGKIAVNTGGASGMGLATAKRFVSEGAYVFIIDRNKKELDTSLSELGKNVSSGIQNDVSILAELDKSFNIIKSSVNLRKIYSYKDTIINIGISKAKD